MAQLSLFFLMSLCQLTWEHTQASPLEDESYVEKSYQAPVAQTKTSQHLPMATWP
jgi:hypothetical protein